jgi:hypothetical protein
MTTRTIHLHESDTASYGEAIYTAAGRHDPIAPLLRRLIAEGRINANDMIEIRRGDTLCFKRYKARHWAAFDTVDHPRDGLARRSAFVGPHLGSVTVDTGPPQPRGPFRPQRRANEADAGTED